MSEVGLLEANKNDRGSVQNIELYTYLLFNDIGPKDQKDREYELYYPRCFEGLCRKVAF